MQYFVTGATGFVGGRVAHQLLDAGHDVVVLARNPEDATDLADAGAAVVQGDITDVASMRDPMTGVDGVFHIAGWYRVGVDDPSVGERVNVQGTRTVMKLARDLDVPKVVYTSTLAVNSDTNGRIVDEDYSFEGEHLTHYDRTKWEAHYEVVAPMAADGLPVVTVMPGAVYGPGDTSQLGETWRDWLTGDLPVIPQETAYAWGHVDDIAQGHILAMTEGTPGETYHICGENYTLVEAFRMAANMTGIDAPRALPPWVFHGLAGLTSVLNRVVDLPSDYHPETLRTLAGVTYLGDNTKARTELGLEHRPFRQGLRDLLRHELARIGDAAPDTDLEPSLDDGPDPKPHTDQDR